MTDLKSDYPRATNLAEILKALAHPVRLMLVAILCEEKKNVGELAEMLNLSQAIVSQQLRILRMCDLVETQRESGFAVYSLKEPQLKNLIACLQSCQTDSK